jgi:tetratricopeptide (TPR) repeat protein
VEDYLGQARAAAARKPPSPDLAAAFRSYTERALSLAETRLRNGPGDAEAQFQLGAAAGLRASYVATVEGSVRDSIGPARRAYSAQKRCLALDPRRKDAGLIVGLYQYAVASLPLPLKLLARVAGFESGRESGLRFVEEASRYPDNPQTQTNALFALVLLYSREGRHSDALAVIRQLQQRYPRNRLLHLEAGSAAFRAGRPAEALEHVDRGLAQVATDPRPRAFGEEARWRYLRGAALVQLRRTDTAERDLQAVLALEAARWIRGRAHLELGKIADLSGERPRAMAAYQQAMQDCRADRDSPCQDAARRFLSETYR